ncbi:MAG TPA: hypothetical protein VFG47_22625 [Geminicoccaceae bacterium]|nr:hypothetical protein [Geminicoccaceae bacterium]
MRAWLLAGACVALLAAGSARAEPVTLEVGELDGVTAGTANPVFGLWIAKDVDIKKRKDIDVRAYLDVRPEIVGNLAESEAGARAYGKHTFTETLTLSESVEGLFSQSFSESVAGSRGAHFKRHVPLK